jgi:hypothetical protein
MLREVVSIDLDTVPVYEAGAKLFAVLAYPDDVTRYEQYFVALCRAWLEQKTLSDPAWALSQQPIRPAFFAQGEAFFRRTLHAGGKLFRHRMVSTRQVMPHLKAIEMNKEPLSLTVGPYTPTVNNMAILMARDFDLSDGSAATMKADVWAPSKPVIHMAAALAQLMQLMAKSAKVSVDRVPYEVFLDSAPLLRLAIEIAETHRLRLPEIKQFTIREQDTIQFVAS